MMYAQFLLRCAWAGAVIGILYDADRYPHNSMQRLAYIALAMGALSLITLSWQLSRIERELRRKTSAVLGADGQYHR